MYSLAAIGFVYHHSLHALGLAVLCVNESSTRIENLKVHMTKLIGAPNMQELLRKHWHRLNAIHVVTALQGQAKYVFGELRVIHHDRLTVSS